MVKEYSNISCPACNSEMKQIFLKEQNIYIDVCEKCGGIYFDNRELEKYDESFENSSEIIDFLNGKELINVDSAQVRVCPVCGTNMVKNFTSFNKEIEIDVCYSCGGKFLDNGELQKIREQNNQDMSIETEIVDRILSQSFEIEENYISNKTKRAGNNIRFIIPLLIIIITISCIFILLSVFK